MRPQNLLFICMGNICRSPAAHAVMENLNQKHRLGWRIDSCGTDAFHQGAAPDRRMQRELIQQGYPKFQHTAQRFRLDMAYQFDLLLAMDFHNYDRISEHIRHDKELLVKLHLFRDFDPQMPPSQRGQVPDPYYNGEKSFREVFQMIERTCEHLVQKFAPPKKTDVSLTS
ncbi:MAG: low molecular weight protein-tyrosine-phosphatase [Spirochaetota bacterium]